MGYTHYYDFKRNPKTIENGKEKFKKAVKLLKDGLAKIPQTIEIEESLLSEEENGYKTFMEKKPFILRGGNGTGEPEITDSVVCFNGDAETDEDGEAFYIPFDSLLPIYQFCKTNRRAYDVAVCLAILCFKNAFGSDFEFSSDGDIKNGEEGWKLAKEIMQTLE